MEKDYKKLWVRAGVTLHITDEEADKILDHDANSTSLSDVVRQIIAEGRFEWDGDSYIPATCISDFNKEYGTDYDDEDEPEWNF